MNDKAEKRGRSRPRRRISGGDILALLVLACVLWVIPDVMLGLMNPEGSGEFSFYNGPMLPLSSISGGGEVEVVRDVTLDFSIYNEPKEYQYAPERVLVTDAYTLTNPTDQPVTMELFWCFEGKLSEQIPVITLNGEAVQAPVRTADAVDDYQSGIENFREYSEALMSRNLPEEAMAKAPEWDETVKVYHFYDLKYEGTENTLPMLAISYKYTNKTNLWMRDCDMSGTKNGRSLLYFNLGEDVWLYVPGEDLKELEVSGAIVHTTGIHTASKVEGVTYELETYEASFADCLWEAAQGYTYETEKQGTGVELVTPEMRYDAVMREIAETDRMPGNSYSMGVEFRELYTDKRMLCWAFPVEIPAGGAVKVSAAYVKVSNSNSEGDRHGYELAATLGSNLRFTEQRVRLVNTEPVALAPLLVDGEMTGYSQNFGFDLHAGITEVSLDLSQDRYYLDLILLKES